MTELVRIFRPVGGECRLVAVSDNWISLSETVEFRGAGEVQLTLGAGSSAAGAVSLGDILLVGGEAFVAERVTRDAKTHEVRVRAPGLLSYLGRRIASVTSPETLPAETAILSLALSAAEDLPLALETAGGGAGENVMLTPRTENLLSLLERLATLGGRGLEMTLSPSEGTMILSSPAMLDRTVGSASPVVLGTDMDTLLDTEETVDLGTYRNAVTVTSAEEAGGTVLTETVTAAECSFGDGWDDDAAGVREAYLSPSISKRGFTVGDVFDEVSYRLALRERGREYLAKHRPVVTLTARVPSVTAAGLSPGDLVSVRAGGGLLRRLVTKKTTVRRRGESLCSVVLADDGGIPSDAE